MQRSYRYAIIVAVALLMVAGQACKKSVGNYSNVVIQTPYTLYFSDSAGTLYNTNDGDTIKPLVFPPDGYLSRGIAISGENIMWIKKNLYLSTNNGSNFNIAFSLINPAAFDQSMILDAPDEGRLYIASSIGLLGVQFSEKHGEAKSWRGDTLISLAIAGDLISSFTQLSNKAIVGFSSVSRYVYKKDSKMSSWVKTSTDDNKLLPGGLWTVGHYNNSIVAIDHGGINGAWHSEDNGFSWQQYTGLPTRRLLSVASPFDQVLLIGTDSAGLYRLQSGTSFVAANNGLSDYTVVNGIVAKQNIYKNSKTTSQDYVFLTTNHGLYRSQDMGLNWVRVQQGNYISIY